MDKGKVLSVLIEMVINAITPDRLKEFVDMILDFVENIATDSSNKFDDSALLPICRLIRSTFDIPDNDEDDY